MTVTASAKLDEALSGNCAYVIGEIGQAHEGRLGVAHSYIDFVADAGVDAVKFQTHIADEESSEFEEWRVKFSTQDETRHDYWKRMEFSKDQWIELKSHAEQRGLLFLSSPFSIAAVRLLNEIGVAAWKIPSGEITNYLLLDHIIETGKPIFLSSGMSTLDEIESSLKRIRASNLPHVLFQCTTAYPCPPDKIGLNIISDFIRKYECPIGLSDHSGTIFPSLSATTLGANFVEVHAVMSKKMFGPDVSSSLNFQQLNDLVDGIRMVQTMRSSSTGKDDYAASAKNLRKTFGQSLCSSKCLSSGEVLSLDMISSKKPMIGIPAQNYESFLGKKIIRNVEKGSFLRLEDFE